VPSIDVPAGFYDLLRGISAVDDEKSFSAFTSSFRSTRYSFDSLVGDNDNMIRRKRKRF